jgi:hypothetical protein
VIEFPKPKKKFMISSEQIIEIECNLEKQGGNKYWAWRSCQILKEVTKEWEM